jgi:hypothetical protein
MSGLGSSTTRARRRAMQAGTLGRGGEGERIENVKL